MVLERHADSEASVSLSVCCCRFSFFSTICRFRPLFLSGILTYFFKDLLKAFYSFLVFSRAKGSHEVPNGINHLSGMGAPKRRGPPTVVGPPCASLLQAKERGPLRGGCWGCCGLGFQFPRKRQRQPPVAAATTAAAAAVATKSVKERRCL